jgi:hypothetical protein
LDFALRRCILRGGFYMGREALSIHYQGIPQA